MGFAYHPKASKNNLIHCTNDYEKARILAVMAEHASDWLNAYPIPSLGLKLDDTQIKIACDLRLGSPICHSHTCICGTKVESNGYHGLSCKKSSGRFPRHAQINDLINRALQTPHIPPVL